MQGVYWILNSINGKMYIGSAVNIERRWKEHVSKLNRKVHINKHLQNAWLKHGAATFTFEVVEIVEDELWLKAREQAWIQATKCQKPEMGYNTLCNAWVPSKHRIGMHHSEAAKEKLRKAWIARKARGEVHHFTAADREKSRLATIARKGKKISEQGVQNIRDSWTIARRETQARNLAKQLEKDPGLIHRGAVAGAAARWKA